MRILLTVTVIVEITDDLPEVDEIRLVHETGLDLPLGRVEWRTVRSERLVAPGDARCDFCSDAGPVYCYPCRDFLMARVLPELAEASAGAWLACGPCSAYIEASDWVALAHRSTHLFVATRPGTDRQKIHGVIAELHQRFAEHQDGERVALTEETVVSNNHDDDFWIRLHPGPSKDLTRGVDL